MADAEPWITMSQVVVAAVIVKVSAVVEAIVLVVYLMAPEVQLHMLQLPLLKQTSQYHHHESLPLPIFPSPHW